MTARAVDEWIGATPDTPAPPRVRLRVFERHDGVCGISGRKIQVGDEWQVDHILALINGGENRETNLQPVLKEPHREKTRKDVAIKAKCDRLRKKHLGLWKSRQPLPGGKGDSRKKKVGGEVVRR